MGKLLDSVVEWLLSKKTKHALSACVPLVIGGATGAVPWSTVIYGCSGVFGLANVSQGIADRGKEAAKVNAAAGLRGPQNGG